MCIRDSPYAQREQQQQHATKSRNVHKENRNSASDTLEMIVVQSDGCGRENLLLSVGSRLERQEPSRRCPDRSPALAFIVQWRGCPKIALDEPSDHFAGGQRGVIISLTSATHRRFSTSVMCYNVYPKSPLAHPEARSPPRLALF